MKKFLVLAFIVLTACDSGAGDNASVSVLPDFPIPIGTAGAGFYNGDLYVFGGSINYNGDSNYTSIYQLNGTTWTQVDTMMNNATWDGKLLISGDEAYYMGGWNGINSSLQKYNFISKAWTPLTAGHISQNWGATAQLLNNKIYHFGSNGQVDVYDIAGGIWTLADTNSHIRNNEYALTSVVYQGNIYVTGYGDSSLYKYDVTENQFSLESPIPRSICGSAMAQSGAKIYFISGSSDGNSANVFSDSYVYDLANKSWVPFDSPTPVMYSGTAVYGNKIFLVGGFDLNEAGTTGTYSITMN